MALSAVFLDAGPLGLVTGRPQTAGPDACRAWGHSLAAAGLRIIVPEIADYEVRRELLRAEKVAGVNRLESFNQTVRYLALTTEAMREAARLWALARNSGQPTASPAALDADVILAGQVLDFCRKESITLTDTGVATVNVRHLARFVPAQEWIRLQV